MFVTIMVGGGSPGEVVGGTETWRVERLIEVELDWGNSWAVARATHCRITVSVLAIIF